jgi:hypothetical protein
MRMSCLITTQNPMTKVTNPARLTQSPTFSFAGSSVVIIEKGRATFTLFLPLCDLFLSLRDGTPCAGRDLRARVVPLSTISQPSHQWALKNPSPRVLEELIGERVVLRLAPHLVAHAPILYRHRDERTGALREAGNRSR